MNLAWSWLIPGVLLALVQPVPAQPRTSPLNQPLSEPVALWLSEADADRAGQTLAAELRSLRPAQSAAFSGLLKIRDRSGRMTHVPFTSRITAGDEAWTVAYETAATNQHAAEQLRVIHRPSQPNQYLYARAPSPGASVGEFKSIPPGQAAVPLAGSDFFLCDLGLDFFHWPQQTLVKKEMRKGRPCQLLSSRPAPGAATNGYERVVSWIDTETGGLLIAEAFGPGDKLWKEFEVKSFKKVDGQWQLRDMEIRDAQKKSRTRLEFDLETN